jgi:L-malate glycosyltransferase
MKVLFAQRRLPHYRLPLIELTRELLAKHGIDFDFVYGEPSQAERSKADEGHLPWAQRMAGTHYAFGDKLVWQPFATGGYDLVIVTQENRLLFNHWLCRSGRPFRLAFFGHGANLAAKDSQSVLERFKRWTTRRADWWFAYTELSRNLVTQGAGFDAERVTVLNNASDTRALKADLNAITPTALQQCQQTWGLTPGFTGLFLSSIYPGKALPLLLQAVRAVHAAYPAFRLLVVGEGPSRAALQASAANQSYVHWLGAKHGADKALVMAASDFLLLPSFVGLSVVDGFAAGLPLLTTSAPGHGPEIAYLHPGRNGQQTEPEPQAYAQAICALLAAPDTMARWKTQALQDGQVLTMQAMAHNFAQGVLLALAAPRLGAGATP